MKNFKKSFCSLLVVFVFVTMFPVLGLMELDLLLPGTNKAYATAYSGACGENASWELNVETGSMVITGFGEIRSRNQQGAWSENERNIIKSVVISDGITSIGAYTFYGCVSLEEIEIPSSVLTIGSYAFAECNSLKNVSMVDGLQEICIGAFRRCSALETIVIPDTVQTLGGSFGFCTNLKTITIGKDILKIDRDAFLGCTNLNTINFNAVNCYDMGSQGTSYAFEDNDSIETVNFGSSVIRVPEGAFYSCEGLKNISFSGNNMRVIGKNAFLSCDSLEKVILPKGITEIEMNAFGSKNLSYIHIPESTSKIGSSIAYKDFTYLCSTTEKCYAREYANKNDYEFKVCDGHGLSDTNGLILTPSTNEIDYGETLILHINKDQIPENSTIVWSVEGDAVNIRPSEKGDTCAVLSQKTGNVTVKVTVLDEEGNEDSAEVEITSNASLWHRFVSFIFNLFKFDRTIKQST